MGGSSILSTKRAPRTFAKGEGGLFVRGSLPATSSRTAIPSCRYQ